METSTGAWSRRPVAPGWSGVTSTSIVGAPLPPPWLLLEGVVATLPTYVTRPGVVELSGSVMATASPILTLDCCDASSAIVMTRRTDVMPSTGPAWTGAPLVGVTLVTRTAPGSNTTAPSSRLPVAGTLRAAWNRATADSVAEVNASPESGP